MFVRFTQPETGLPIRIRAARVQAFAATEDGSTRIFLSGALTCLVAEDDDAVLATLDPTPEDER
ncbi:hypothetical protein CEP68_07620 [Brevundimonas vesicularis]|uniref:Uncharacterized protein n=2 Tax=Brevundimonas vesicularis TaxID=41276 RepID=A0A1Z3U7Z9_BREVE|nr:hypothetical protein CEP68_07620 [Brevundimonas vesicularis]